MPVDLGTNFTDTLWPSKAAPAILIEHKFLRVQQGPENILVRRLLVLSIFREVRQGRIELLGRRLVRKRPEEQLLDLFRIGPLVVGASENVNAAAATAQLALD